MRVISSSCDLKKAKINYSFSNSNLHSDAVWRLYILSGEKY